jgi:AcrR family transcriptional regulator
MTDRSASSLADAGRPNQRRRTRKDLLQAAARLLKAGHKPTLEEVAAEALVSRATAYRYFPSVEALLVEAPLDGEVPDPADLFRDDPSTDPAERVDRAEKALHEVVFGNEAQLRLMLINAVSRAANRTGKDDGATDGVPVRQNRRTPLIEAALAPARRRLSNAAYEKLCAALALIFGTEAMIVFRDVLGMDEKAARKVKSWAVRALVAAALDESPARPGRTNGT